LHTCHTKGGPFPFPLVRGHLGQGHQCQK
jgi:hypothetical protein